VRVIGGSLRGRRLAAPRGSATRPTAARVREALFAFLEPLEGAAVLDLFAGSGALGIEALSRGASQVVFVERSRQACAALRANLERLGVGPPLAVVRCREALAALRQASRLQEKYDLVLLDPPYARGRTLEPQLYGLVAAVLADGGRAVVECDARQPLGLAGRPARERRYGDTLLRIYRKEDMMAVEQDRSRREEG